MAVGVTPDPLTLHPVADQPRVVLLKPLITSPLIEVGEFSYYDDPEFGDEFETRNVLHHTRTATGGPGGHVRAGQVDQRRSGPRRR